MTFQPANSLQAYVSTTNYLPDDPAQGLIRIQELFNQFGKAINFRDIALYEEVEINTGQAWFETSTVNKKRNAFRKVFPFGAIPTNNVLTLPHGISPIITFTFTAGSIITDTPDFRPLPYVDTVNVTNQVSLRLDATNIYVTNGATAPNITFGILTLEYLKN